MIMSHRGNSSLPSVCGKLWVLGHDKDLILPQYFQVYLKGVSHSFLCSLKFLKRCEVCNLATHSRSGQHLYELEMWFNNLGGDTGD